MQRIYDFYNMKTRTCAKINLGLNIVNKRADGYHNLETVFYPIPLYDEIEIVENPHSPERCTLDISGMSIEGDSKKNLVVRAYDSLAGRFPLPNVLIRLKKNIPMQAGLGGRFGGWCLHAPPAQRDVPPSPIGRRIAGAGCKPWGRLLF